MNNFAETVKQFYSQGYRNVYDEGQPIDIESIKPPRNWFFHIHGLAIPKAEELLETDLKELIEKDLVDKFVYQLRFAFNLETVHIRLCDLQHFKINRKFMGIDGENYSKSVINQLPDSFWESCNFYRNIVEEQDWGCVWPLRITIEGQDTLAIRVTTDGSDGWLEVFDTQGHNLASARTSEKGIAWRSTNLIREQVYKKPRFPPELA